MNYAKANPVLVRSTTAMVLAVFGTVLAKFGIDSSGVAMIVSIALSVGAYAVGYLRIKSAHNKVTTLANPKAADGTPLMPVAKAA